MGIPNQPEDISRASSPSDRRWRLGLFPLALVFGIGAALLDSKTALINLGFMALVALARRPLRRLVERSRLPAAVSLVGFGTGLGLAEEALWYFGHLLEHKPQAWLSLADDWIRTGPTYGLLFLAVYLWAGRFRVTARQSFVYGGVAGYVFYFVMEGVEVGFRSLGLLAFWEINNFLLNGFLVCLPLYVTGQVVERHPRRWFEHVGVTLILLLIVLVAVGLTAWGLALAGYQPIRWGV